MRRRGDGGGMLAWLQRAAARWIGLSCASFSHAATSPSLHLVTVTCFAEAGGQYVSEMARAVELLGLCACSTKSIMDCGDGLPPNWSSCSTDDCIQELISDYFLDGHDSLHYEGMKWQF